MNFQLDPKTTTVGLVVLGLVVISLFIPEHEYRDKVYQLALAIAGAGLLYARDGVKRGD